MSTPSLDFKCNKCNTDWKIEIPEDAVEFIRSSNNVKKNRGLIKPQYSINVFKINSDEIKVFLQQKVQFYKAGTKLELVPKYTEKKVNGEIKSYAALQIALSQEVLDIPEDFYTKIGNTNNLRFVNDIWVEMINKYKFDKKDIDGWLSSYKRMEEIENKLGITEKFLEELKDFSTPTKVSTNKENWIIFAARADLVIEDMLTSSETGKLEGTMEIQSITPINQSLVEFTIYMMPNIIRKENPFIRKLLSNNK